MKYKCLICGKEVKLRKASFKMKEEKVCEKCFLEYVFKAKEVGHEDRLHRNN